MSRKDRKSIEDLPPEVLLKIFSHKNAKRLSETSKEYSNVYWASRLHDEFKLEPSGKNTVHNDYWSERLKKEFKIAPIGKNTAYNNYWTQRCKVEFKVPNSKPNSNPQKLYRLLEFLNFTPEERKSLTSEKYQQYCQESDDILNAHKKLSWSSFWLSVLHLNTEYKKSDKALGEKLCKESIMSQSMLSIDAAVFWININLSQPNRYEDALNNLKQKAKAKNQSALVCLIHLGLAKQCNIAGEDVIQWNETLNKLGCQSENLDVALKLGDTDSSLFKNIAISRRCKLSRKYLNSIPRPSAAIPDHSRSSNSCTIL